MKFDFFPYKKWKIAITTEFIYDNVQSLPTEEQGLMNQAVVARKMHMLLTLNLE
jgi:hypothetical protein